MNKQQNEIDFKVLKKSSLKLASYISSALLTGVMSISFGLALVYWFWMPYQNDQLLFAAAADQSRELADKIDKGLSLQQDDVITLARLPSVTEKIVSKDAEQIRLLSNQLSHLYPKFSAVRIFSLGQARTDFSNKTPLTFTGLDMIRRVEQGEQSVPEAFAHDRQWLVNFVAPVLNNQREIIGTLIATSSLSMLMHQWLDQDLRDEVLEIKQVVDNQGQTIYAWGRFKPELVVHQMQLPINNWQLNVQPNLQLKSPLSVLDLLFPAIVVCAIFFVGVMLVLLSLSRRIREDGSRFLEYLQHSSIHPGMPLPSFSLTFTEALAQPVRERLRKLVAATAQLKEESEITQSSALRAENTVGERTLPRSKTLHTSNRMLADVHELEALPENYIQSGQPVKIEPEVFREYDIRGIVSKNLGPEVIHLIGRAIGSEVLDRGEHEVFLGYDGRLSSPELSVALKAGLQLSGCHVIDLQRITTPMLYFAAATQQSGSGVMITGSHNPPEYNGVKIVIKSATLSGADIQVLQERIEQKRFHVGSGAFSELNILPEYLARIQNDIVIARPLKVVVDCANGVTSQVAPPLLESLGVDVVPIFCEVDGRFPNHSPDTSDPENLTHLVTRVLEEQADIGIAFDGDGDRVVAVTNQGEIVWPDRLLMLFAKDVLSRNPGADILYDVKCTRRLKQIIDQHGGRAIMWKTGHSLMKNKMHETGALLAGEMSGHIFFQERWYGFDDGVYAALRLLEVLGLENRSFSELIAELPSDISTPEIGVLVDEAEKFELVERLKREVSFPDASVTDIDGLRVEFTEGWGLVRASNTSPKLTFRFEADSEANLEKIRELFKEKLSLVAPSLQLPF